MQSCIEDGRCNDYNGYTMIGSLRCSKREGGLPITHSEQVLPSRLCERICLRIETIGTMNPL